MREQEVEGGHDEQDDPVLYTGELIRFPPSP